MMRLATLIVVPSLLLVACGESDPKSSPGARSGHTCGQ